MYRYVITLLILLFAVNSFAAPAISGYSGTVTHDGTVTISGSDFGSKSTAAPLKWEDFEDGTVGNDPTDGAFWTASNANGGNEYSTTVSRTTNSPKTVEHTMTGANSNQAAFYHDFSDFNTSGKWVASWWFYINDVALPDGSNSQLKIWQLQRTDAHSSAPMFGGYWLPNDDDETTWQYIYSYYGGGYDTTVTEGNLEIGNPADIDELKWYQITVQSLNSTGSGAEDGSLKVWATGSGMSDEITVSGVENLSASDLGITTVKFGYITVNSTVLGEVYTYWDDMYFDDSWARVEIGDNSVYDDCTHREMQLPSAWAAGEITITVNQGGIADLTGKYLFVVDSDGTASAGFLINTATMRGVSINN